MTAELESAGGRRGSADLPGLTVAADAKPRFSKDAEQSVVGKLLADPRLCPDIIGVGLEPEHFYGGPTKALFREVMTRYWADDPIDALVVGEVCSRTLARAWSCDEGEAVRRVEQLAGANRGRKVDLAAHGQIVKRYADYRALLDLSARITQDVDRELESPEEIAGLLSQSAMEIATSTLLTNEIVSFEDLGRHFVNDQRRLMAARAQGVELGAYFGLSFIDSFTRGLRPSELLFVAGEPGAGKSAITWTAAQMFAEKQAKVPFDKSKPGGGRIGTLVLSLEMAEQPSSTRLAQAITRLDGGKLREGRTEEHELAQVIAEWKKRRDLPLYFNFSSTMRASQLKAMVVHAIQRHNVGLVVIDHFKYLDMDGRWRSELEQEEAKARFLKQDIATQLNVAVVCLAHTTKAIEGTDDGRPRLSHLRGSGQVAAHADFVAFVYRPYSHARQSAIDAGDVKRTDAELIWSKNRHGLEGTARFYFDASTMHVY